MEYYFSFINLKHFKPCFFILKAFTAFLLKLKRDEKQYSCNKITSIFRSIYFLKCYPFFDKPKTFLILYPSLENFTTDIAIIQTYQTLTNFDEVCIPGLSSILLAVYVTVVDSRCIFLCPLKTGRGRKPHRGTCCNHRKILPTTRYHSYKNSAGHLLY